MQQVVRFGVYEVDLASAELRKQGTLLRLQEQPFQILRALLEHPGQVVTREELIQRLWADGTVVDFDRGLNAAVTRLRQVLSDQAESPRYVETVARRGYRFIAPVETPSPEPSPPEPAVPLRPRSASPWAWAAVAMALLAVAGVWWTYRTGSLTTGNLPTSTAPLKMVPLSTEPGTESNVSFSPDGTQIVYGWQKEGEEEPHVYVRQVGMGDPVRLTKAVEGEHGPAWSRDGRYIAFLRAIDEQKLALIVAPALGAGPERQLAELPAPDAKQRASGGLFRSLDWTPDGRHLIVAAFKPTAPGTPKDSLAGLMRISTETAAQGWIYPPPASHLHGASGSPAVSPDGKTLAFVRSFSVYGREIFLQTIGKDVEPIGPPVQLTKRGLAVYPVWTSDGREIIFTSLEGPYRIAARPGAPAEALSALGPDVRIPAIARNGRLAFTRVFRDANIWAFDFATGQLARRIDSTTMENAAEYSPDGRRIALQSQRSGRWQIWVCDSDGTRCGQVGEMAGVVGSPRWSPDGRQIAFDSDGGSGKFDVYTINAGGGAPQRLTTHAADEAAPSWSRDGRWIYFLSNRAGRNEIWKIPSTGGAETQVTRNGGMMAVESFDGQHLYYSRGDGISALFRSRPDGSAETQIIDRLLGRCFAVTRDSIYYLVSEKSGSSLRAYGIATGADTLVANLPKRVQNGLSISPDGKTAIFAQVDSVGSDLVMVQGFR